MATATRNRSHRAQTAEHRPAQRKRNFQHDDIIAGDLFSGFGGLTKGMEMAGVTTILAANHNRYKVEVHEANHPDAEHWVCDLVDTESGDYHSPRDLPKVDWLAAGISCKHHSQSNAKKAYRSTKPIHDYHDPEWEERVTRSERDRATAICVLQYCDIHHPRIVLVECTTELTSWGNALPDKPKIGDGKTYQWWLNEMHKLGYRSRAMYLNSMFFGVPQSRDRIYIAFWDSALRAPDLEHRPIAWCEKDGAVEAVWTWRTGVPPSGRVRFGEQYDYHCPTCGSVVVPPRAPAINALDLTNLGTRIGDRDSVGMKPLAASSMARIERCIQRFREFPAILMPAKAIRGVDRHPWQPMGTQTSQQETALVSTGALMVMAGNRFEHPGSECRSRHLVEPLWTQHATNAHGLLVPPRAAEVTAAEGARLLAAGVIPYRQHTIPQTHAEPMCTFTSDQIPGVLAAAIFKQNGGPNDTAPHPLSDPLGTTTSVDSTGLAIADWHRMLDGLTPEECYYRMMFPHEVQAGCGFDQSFIVWGSARDQIDGYGNAVSPSVGMWLSLRLKEIL